MLVPDSHKQTAVSVLSWFFSVSTLLQISEWSDYNWYLRNKAKLSKINHFLKIIYSFGEPLIARKKKKKKDLLGFKSCAF